ncbi:MAG TPA: 3-dehydroquinate synthase [Clostridiales bacterium]|nr:3-dehydroquinate synthase [Clostridiales bacterium]
MKTIKLHLIDKNYEINIGDKLTRQINRFIKEKNYSKVVYLLDVGFYAFHKQRMNYLMKDHDLIFNFSGEDHKNLDSLNYVLKEMINYKMDRKSVLIVVGGGVTGDVGALAASIYMRGISVIQIPTTLLSQVDSSVGGKTAINFSKIKNIIGTFHQPDAVFIDTSFLKTLTRQDILSGIGEIIKYGFIMDESFIDYLKLHMDELIQMEPTVLEYVIHESIRYKAQVVMADEKESDYRKILNFGHTIGHGIEMLEDTGLSHGQAVAAGINYESVIAYDRNLISKEYLDEIKNLCGKVVTLQAFTDNEKNEIIASLTHDKKNEGDSINMVLPVSRGQARIIDNIEKEEIYNSFRSII